MQRSEVDWAALGSVAVSIGFVAVWAVLLFFLILVPLWIRNWRIRRYQDRVRLFQKISRLEHPVHQETYERKRAKHLMEQGWPPPTVEPPPRPRGPRRLGLWVHDPRELNGKD